RRDFPICLGQWRHRVNAAKQFLAFGRILFYERLGFTCPLSSRGEVHDPLRAWEQPCTQYGGYDPFISSSGQVRGGCHHDVAAVGADIDLSFPVRPRLYIDAPLRQLEEEVNPAFPPSCSNENFFFR